MGAKGNATLDKCSARIREAMGGQEPYAPAVADLFAWVSEIEKEAFLDGYEKATGVRPFLTAAEYDAVRENRAYLAITQGRAVVIASAKRDG
jgi:hypothetical protein